VSQRTNKLEKQAANTLEKMLAEIDRERVRLNDALAILDRKRNAIAACLGKPKI